MSQLDQHDGAEDELDRRAQQMALALERRALFRSLVPLMIMSVGFSGVFVMGAFMGAWGFLIGIPFQVAGFWWLLHSARSRVPAVRAMQEGRAPYHSSGKGAMAIGWLLVVGGVYGGFALGPEVQDLLESWW